MFEGLYRVALQFRVGTTTGALADRSRKGAILELVMPNGRAAAALQWGLLKQQPEKRILQPPAREETGNIYCLQSLFSVRSHEPHKKQQVREAFPYSSCAVQRKEYGEYDGKGKTHFTWLLYLVFLDC